MKSIDGRGNVKASDRIQLHAVRSSENRSQDIGYQAPFFRAELQSSRCWCSAAPRPPAPDPRVAPLMKHDVLQSLLGGERGPIVLVDKFQLDLPELCQERSDLTREQTSAKIDALEIGAIQQFQVGARAEAEVAHVHLVAVRDEQALGARELDVFRELQ